MPGRPDQRDADRKAARLEAAGHGNRRQIQQIGEVRVIAKVRIAVDRLGFQLRKAEGGPGRRHQQDVGLVPHGADGLCEFLQAILGLEGIHGSRGQADLDDAARDRKQHVRLDRQHRADGRGALRRPGAVEKIGRLHPGGEIDFQSGAPQGFGPRDRLGEEGLSLDVAEEFELSLMRYGEGEGRRRLGQRCLEADGRGPRVGILRVEPVGYVQHRQRIGHGQREDRNAVDGPAGGDHAAIAEHPRVGLRPTILLKAAGTRPEPRYRCRGRS